MHNDVIMLIASNKQRLNYTIIRHYLIAMRRINKQTLNEKIIMYTGIYCAVSNNYNIYYY